MKKTCVTFVTLFLLASQPAVGAARQPRCEGARATKVGTPGDDRIVGTGKQDVIVGLGGDDVIIGLGNHDRLCGGRGADRIYGKSGEDLLDGDRGNDLLVGGRAGDGLVGDEGADQIRGVGGADRFLAGHDPGPDTFHGGGGPDLLNLAVTEPSEGEPDDASGPAFLDLATGELRSPDGGNDTVVVGTIERVYGTGKGDELYGDDGRNILLAGYYGSGATLDGRGGNDTLSTGEGGGTTFVGGPGDDLINPLEGGNDIDGGEGVDEVDFCGPYAGTSGDITVDLAEGRSEARIRDEEPDVNRLASIENVTTCDGDDELLGDADDNRLDGARGTDRIDGREGSDTCLRGEETQNCEG